MNMGNVHASEKDATENGALERKDPSVVAIGGTAVLIGLLSSVCCLGPLVLGTLGIGVGATGLAGSTAHFARALVPDRPYLIVLTLAILSVAFYRAYRPRLSCAPGTGEPCAIKSSRSVRTMRLLVWIMALISLVFVLYPYLP